MSRPPRSAAAKTISLVFVLMAGTMIAVGNSWPDRALAAGPADPLVAGATFTFRDTRTPTQTGFFIGDRIAVGVLDVFPNPESGLGGIQTEASASQAGVSTALEFFGGALGVQYVNSVPFQPSLTGSFDITITNQGSSNSPLIVSTPSLGSTSLVPFAIDGQITPNGSTPRIRWVVPPTLFPDSIRLFIFDLSRQASDGSALVIHAVNLPAAATFYDVPAILDSGDSLHAEGRYEIAVMLQKNRDDGSLLSRSRRFYQFSPPVTGPLQELPTVGPDNIFRFDFDAARQESYILHLPRAVGYRYDAGPGDPSFLGVTMLSDFGSDYKLSFRHGRRKVVRRLAPGETFDFLEYRDVTSFEVRLLRPSVNNRSNPGKLLLSQVAFMANDDLPGNRFTGTATPISLGRRPW